MSGFNYQAIWNKVMDLKSHLKLWKIPNINLFKITDRVKITFDRKLYNMTLEFQAHAAKPIKKVNVLLVSADFRNTLYFNFSRRFSPL
jgi:hypothetical protein